MKLKFIIVLFFLFIVRTGYSQLNYGVKGGLNSNNIKSDSYFDYPHKSLPSFHLGVIFEKELSNKFIFLGEILYSKKGFTADFQTDSHDVYLNYINMPILFKFKPIKRIGLEVGPEIGYLLSSKFKSIGNPSQDAAGLYNYKLDFNLDLGISIDIISHIGLGIRYCYGLSDVYNEESVQIPNSSDPIFDTKLTNRTIQFSLTYNFNNHKQHLK
jgi:hypothetical protein